MSVHGLWPREAPRPTDSHAERRVWDALAAHLPKGWTAWHSLRIRDERRIDGEGDFVLAVPDRGMLVLEVKGGRVEVEDGRWLQNGRPMERAPREQGLGYARRLLQRLAAQRCRPPAFGVATCFPDVSFDAPPSQDDVHGCVLGEQDLPWLGDALEAVVERALPPADRERGRWVEALHDMWGESWVPRARLGQRARLDDAERLRLDAEQLDMLECLAGNDRVLVEGGAGTGKTVLACETARRLAREGRRVLLVCFTDALAHWLAAHVDGGTAAADGEADDAGGRRVDGPGSAASAAAGFADRMTVATVRGLAAELLREAGRLTGDPREPADWEELPWNATDELTGTPPRWDAVVVDEAQDFSLGDWALVDACAAPGRLLWAFHDPAQAFWHERTIPEDLFGVRFRLSKSYRCPPELALVARAYAGAELDETALAAAVEQGQLGVVGCPSESSVPDKIATEIDKLLSEGLRPQDIAVVSVRGRSAEGAVIQRDRLGRHPLVSADADAMDRNVVAETFLRFKGLERPAVIVTDLRLVQDHRDVRMHIALTRALTTCRVVAPRDVLAAEPVLGRAARLDRP